MAGYLSPEYVLSQIEKGRLSLVYLFYGPCEFRLEKILNRIRETFIPESARDFNVQVFYGDTSDPAEIIESARSLPFLSPSRLVIVRRTENFSAAALEGFIPYIERPVESTCLIFVSKRPNFTRKFYSKIKGLGQAINFEELKEKQVVPQIRKMAMDLGLDIEVQACAYLQQIVGNQLRDLHSELEKLYLRFGDETVGIEEVRELAISSRIYTIFELMDVISSKRQAESLSVLKRYLEEDKDGALKILGMLNRQIRLLWQSKSVIEGGGRISGAARKLALPPFLVKKIAGQSKNWSTDELERAVHLLYEADGLLKSGFQGNLVLENVILSLCN